MSYDFNSSVILVHIIFLFILHVMTNVKINVNVKVIYKIIRVIQNNNIINYNNCSWIRSSVGFLCKRGGLK